MPSKLSQKKLYAYYLSDAVDNARWFSMIFRDEFRDEPAFSEEILVAKFHEHVASLSSPYADRAEAAEVVLDAYAMSIAGVSSWDFWVNEPSSELGKMGYRAESLVLISAVQSGDAEKWYADRAHMWDNESYNLAHAVPRARKWLAELANMASSREDGYLLSMYEPVHPE